MVVDVFVISLFVSDFDFQSRNKSYPNIINNQIPQL